MSRFGSDESVSCSSGCRKARSIVWCCKQDVMLRLQILQYLNDHRKRIGQAERARTVSDAF